MVEKWKLALKEFLKKYENNDDVVGALLCGSYAMGNQNEYSDIDVCLILKDNCNYQERGNIDSNSYLIEYFINPKWKFEEYMEKQYLVGTMPLVNMVAYGKIIYDLDGSAKELQDKALEYVDKPLKVIKNTKQDKNNYHIWDYLDELKTCLKKNNPAFNLIYYNLLEYIYNAYCEYLSIPKYPSTKIYNILTNEDYKVKYHAFKLPEDGFIKNYIKCFEIDKPINMYKNIERLVDYYYKKQGGFNIRSFKIRNENLREEEL